MHGGATTSPVLMLNCPLCKLHSTTSPSIYPSDKKPGPCVQASSVTKNSPSRLKTASTRSPRSTFNAAPGATSETPHNSIFSDINLLPPRSAQSDQRPVKWNQQNERHKLDQR